MIEILNGYEFDFAKTLIMRSKRFTWPKVQVGSGGGSKQKIKKKIILWNDAMENEWIFQSGTKYQI